MMTCEEVKRLLPFLVKGELEDDVMAEVQLHVGYCPACQEAYRKEVALVRTLRKVRLSEPPVPKGLQKSIMHALDQAERELMPPLWQRISLQFAASVAALAVIALLIFVNSWHSSNNFDTFIDDAAARHAKLLPLDIKTNDIKRALAWLDGKLDFGLSDIPLNNKQLQFEGARLSHVREIDAAHFVFRSPFGRRISLFVFPAPKQNPQFCEPINIGGRHVCVRNYRGFTVMFWHRNGIGYALVSQEPKDSLLRIFAP